MRIELRVNGDEREADCWEGESLLYRAAREARPARARRTRASRASAARARCCSTACSSARASCSPRRPTATTSSRSRASPTATGCTAVQEAFVEAGAVQCGFCTPGLVVATVDLLEHDPGPERRRDPRGAVGQPLPLHRLREDLRRGAAWPRGRASVSRGEVTTRRPAQGRGRPHRREPAAARRRPQGQGRVRVLERPRRARDALGPHRPQPARARAHPLDRRLRGASRCPASTPCSRTTTSPARSATGSSSPTSPCSRSTASATSASPSRSSPPSIPSRRAAPPSSIRVEYEPLEPGRPTWSARSRPPSSTPSTRRAATATATTRARTSSAASSIRHGDPDARGRRHRHAASTSSAARIRRSSAPSRGSRCPTARAASTSTSRRSGCTSTARQVAPCLGLPLEQVRIHLAGVGGAFGGREDLSMQIHGALLALHTNRPVKIVYNREESFIGHVHRHPARIWAEHRATRDGQARQRRA